mgnify:CR=1 FL=1
MNENETMEVVATVEQEVAKHTIGKKGKIAIAVGTAIGVGVGIGVFVKHKIKGKKHVTMSLDDMKHQLEAEGATVIMPGEYGSVLVPDDITEEN